MAVWGRVEHEMAARDILARATAHMDDPHARRLREQFDCLQHQLEQLPSRNDSAWILNTGSQFCPGLHTLRQRLLPELVSVLRPNLDAAVVQEMAEVMLNMATSTSSRRFSPCCRRTHNCASRNGSRTTRGRNIWPCHLLRSSYLRLRHRMRGQLIPAPRPRLHLGEGRRTSMRPVPIPGTALFSYMNMMHQRVTLVVVSL